MAKIWSMALQAFVPYEGEDNEDHANREAARTKRILGSLSFEERRQRGLVGTRGFLSPDQRDAREAKKVRHTKNRDARALFNSHAYKGPSNPVGHLGHSKKGGKK